MEIQIFILSTMSPESTAANLNIIDIDFDKTKGTIQRFRLDRKNLPLFQCPYGLVVNIL